jgi:redox-sensitive bicupin YhaK (pirin superfamily)
LGIRTRRVLNVSPFPIWGLTANEIPFARFHYQDMEIITYMISGALEHKDSMGNRDIIRPGEIQHMSAGTGIQHSEYNASDSEAAHVLQLWIEPEKTEL